MHHSKCVAENTFIDSEGSRLNCPCFPALNSTLHFSDLTFQVSYNAFIISDFLLWLSKKDVQEGIFGLQGVDLVVTIRC